MSYQRIPYVIVSCDGCGKELEPGESATVIRKIAKKEGWLYKGRKDYCPKCKEGIQ